MNITDVIALSKAGFTSDQIIQMAQAEQPQQVQQPVQIPQQLPVQMPQPQLIQQPTVPVQLPDGSGVFVAPIGTPAPAPAPAPAPEQQKDPFQQLFEQMTGIKQAIQTQNINNSQMAPAAPQTTDDILASIIQPTKPKED